MHVIKKLGSVIAILLIGLIIFIKFDTGAAAQFTDNVLRPLFGPQIVISIEKIYYNLSDVVDHLTFSLKDGFGPQFLETGSRAEKGNKHLQLQRLTLNSNFKPEAQEGVWLNKTLNLFPDQEIIAYTYVRPDPNRPYAYVTLIQMDMSVLQLGIVAGIKQPGGPVGKPGPGKVPDDIIQSGRLVAAFDGGFQYRDGEFGMIVGNDIYLPLKNDVATLIGYNNGSLKLIDYTGQYLGPSITFIRQNCPMLINQNNLAVNDQRNRKLWGRTLSSDIYTWRSGLGLTKEGNLIYAVGNNLIPETLAQALKMAGATEAMQLDINPYWVRFNIFNHTSNGNYLTTTLLKNLQDGSYQYLHGYEKDFFYVYQR